MKTRRFYLGMFLLVILAIAACTKEDIDINTSELRKEFVGTWAVKDECEKMSYGVEIILDEDNSAQVVIKNYANLGIDVPAIVGGTSIYIDNVKTEGYIINANGKMNGRTIAWSSYGYETDAVLTECTAVFTKAE